MSSVKTSSDASAGSSLPRARPGKSLRGSKASVTNISVYRQGVSRESTAPAPTKQDATPGVKNAPVVNKKNTQDIHEKNTKGTHEKNTQGIHEKNARVSNKKNAQVSDKKNTQAGHKLNTQASNNKKNIKAEEQGLFGSLNRSQVALGIAACLCITATLAAASWPKLMGTDEAQALKGVQDEVDVASGVKSEPITATISQDITQDITQDIAQDTTQAISQDATPVMAIPTEPVVEKPAEPVQLSEQDEKLAETYLTEIGHLRTENVELKHEVKVLTEESIELNEELLALELAEAARVRVVYNFVNDPSQAPANDNNDYYSNSGDQQDPWIVNSEGDAQYDAQLQYDQNDQYYEDGQFSQGEQPYNPNYPNQQFVQGELQYNPEYQNQQFNQGELQYNPNYEQELYEQELYEQELYEQELYEQELYEQELYGQQGQYEQELRQDPDYQYDTDYVFDYGEEVTEENYIQDLYIQQ